MLREVNYEDFGEMMRNKNNWLDIFDPLGKQPELINFVSGKAINRQGEIYYKDQLKLYLVLVVLLMDLQKVIFYLILNMMSPLSLILLQTEFSIILNKNLNLKISKRKIFYSLKE